MSRSAGYPGSRKKLEKMLGEAHQQIRDLENEKFAAREAVGHLVRHADQTHNDIRHWALSLRTARRDLSDSELCGLAAIVTAENRAPTEAFSKLHAELVRRGVLLASDTDGVPQDRNTKALELLRSLSKVWGPDYAVVSNTPRAKEIINRLVAIGGTL